ncbi:TIGR02234 family membrane protein [Corynebacterium sp.]|uniref:TIGR02234 family membrane protein n=1 Tax=Corynebacterium sp. TaxID=1720 RepID=UPI0026DB1915|nr:TIGR02234 family membrane protein [Corynebacterium sp.]MDO5031440.1 TIGR02234 family membrane protein [Corynebacterium sp.]
MAKRRGARGLGALLVFIAAVGLWLSSRLTWAKAAVEDDKSGASVVDIDGSLWSLELVALSLVLLVGCVAMLGLRRTARRVVAIVTALAAAAAAWRPVSLLTYGADPLRAQNLLQGGSSDTAVGSARIAEWATVVSVEVEKAGPLLAILACALGLFGAVMVASNPGAEKARSSKYETPAARQEKLEEELKTSHDSGRVLWDALDADIDPTELPAAKRAAEQEEGQPKNRGS